jgi:hypothetical protein
MYQIEYSANRMVYPFLFLLMTCNNQFYIIARNQAVDDLY